jgi:hypothetical protein
MGNVYTYAPITNQSLTQQQKPQHRSQNHLAQQLAHINQQAATFASTLLPPGVENSIAQICSVDDTLIMNHQHQQQQQMTSLVVVRNESNRRATTIIIAVHSQNKLRRTNCCMIQRLSAAAAAMQHPISKDRNKMSFNKHARVGTLLSSGGTNSSSTMTIIRRQGQYYCCYCWRQLIRAVDIHTNGNSTNAKHASDTILLDRSTLPRTLHKQIKASSMNHIWQIIDLESVSYTINIRIHKFIVVIVVDKLSTAYTMMLTPIKTLK